MAKIDAKSVLQATLSPAGIRLDGPAPWDVRVLNGAFCERVLAGGSLAAGEAFMDGWWDVERLDEFFYRLFAAGLDRRFTDGLGARLRQLTARLVNRQTLERSKDVARLHYNLGND